MSSFLGLASKKIQREAEKIKQRLEGKPADAPDEEYQEHLENFTKQQKHAERLLKDTQAYLKALEAMVQANRALGETVKIVYEPDWAESETIYKAVESIDLMYTDVHAKLEKQVAEPLQSYAQRFPDIRSRISKRERKLLDYHAAKRTVEAAREKGGAKATQAEESFAEVERMFRDLDTELHESLPNFYQGRVSFYSSVMQTMFGENANFHKSCEKLNDELRGSMDRFLEAAGSGMLPVSHPITSRMGAKPKKDGLVSGSSAPRLAAAGPTAAPVPATQAAAAAPAAHAAAPADPGSDSDAVCVPCCPSPQEPMETKAVVPTATVPTAAPVVVPAASAPVVAVPTAAAAPEPVAVPVTAPTTEHAEAEAVPAVAAGPAPTLRIATHAYDATDDDELTFVKGDIITVEPFPDPDDEDDGWFYGRAHGRAGMFPANFTAPHTA